MKNLMKKRLTKCLAIALGAMTAVAPLAACSDKGGDRRDDITYLDVAFYYAGLGDVWINRVAERFEEMYKDYSFEEGKTGVDVIINPDKAGLNGGSLAATINGRPETVYFTENTDYMDYIDKKLARDITHLVTAAPTAGESTIEEKLNKSSYEYFNVGTEAAPKYYMLPYYESFMALNYNIDLFQEKNLYFAKDKTAEEFTETQLNEKATVSKLFIKNATDEKAAGPDGKAGTEDDGLPATYKDFYALLTQLKYKGVTPFVWSGSYLTYLIEFMNAVWTDYEGAEQMNLNFTWDGTAKNLIDVAADGTITEKGDTPITADNAFELQKQAGKYYALQFAEHMAATSDNYLPASVNGLSHTEAQMRFINGGKIPGFEEIGILIDGNWWECEGSSNFVDGDPNLSRQARKFGVMPIPKATKDQIGNPETKLTLNKSVCFIKNNTPENLVEVSEKFFQFVHTNEALNIFSEHTSMCRPFDVELNADTLSRMSYYGKEVYKIHQNVDIINDYPLTDIAIKNTAQLDFKLIWKNGTKVNPILEFIQTDADTAITWFNEMYNTRKFNWQNIIQK